MSSTQLLLSFYGDDFTGSTDALESLARRGLHTVLFTDPPTPQQLARHPRLQAFGVAGLTRSLPPDAMERVLRPAFKSLRESGAPIVHYKVCSTFDSSPHVGSIGRVIDVGMDIFHSKIVPLLVAAPSLGRHCVFGNLFARYGGEGETVRLDRHPSMSRHPTTPMDEADLRLHLAKQTSKPISLLNILQVAGSAEAAEREFDRLASSGPQVMLIDGLHESDLLNAGHLIARQAEREEPLLVVGSSGVESALTAHWQRSHRIGDFAGFAPVGPAGPIVVVSGSCSPVTAGQIEWALSNGFEEVALDTPALVDASQSEQLITAATSKATDAVRCGRSVIIHAGRGPGDERIGQTLAALRRLGESDSSVRGRTSEVIGGAQGAILRRVLETVTIRRVLIAGGDTSSQIARALGIDSVEMIGELTRGSPLCRASAPGSPADGIEITFKGGQIGRREFFGTVLSGSV
jgi:uncharacterized protein YgbK (DUF1537 family)